jgi:hypothetical protein
MFDINDAHTLEHLRGGVLSHLHTLVGFCAEADRDFVTAAVQRQFGVELQVISLGDAAPASVWGLMYPPQSWRGKAQTVLQASAEDQRGELVGFVRGLNYCLQGGSRDELAEDAENAGDMPEFARRRVAVG